VTFRLLMWRREADTVAALADRVVVAVRLVAALELVVSGIVSQFGPAIGEKRNETGLLGWAGERMLMPSGPEVSWFT
jgi:hypothetical protein